MCARVRASFADGKFIIQSLDDVAVELQALIARVRDVCGALTDGDVLRLLAAYQWDDMAAVNAFIETPQQVANAVGIAMPSAASKAQNQRERSRVANEVLAITVCFVVL